MLYQPKKSSVRNTQVGQADNNSSIRKVGEMVKKPLFIKEYFKEFNFSLKIIIFYIIS